MIDLNDKIGKTFHKDHFGSKQTVILEDIRKDKVKLRELDRKDSFTIPIAKFIKFFKES